MLEPRLIMTRLELTQRLTDAVTAHGGEAYLVGGAVRDALLGLPVKDEDVLVTGVPWDTLLAVLQPIGHVDVVGASFGVVKLSRNHVTIDVTLPRTERSTGVGHRDFEVSYNPHLGVESDLERRDFTVNAMAVHLSDGQLVDPFGGANDLENRVLQAVGNASERFSEDPLRMLRAARFMAKLDFTLHPRTREAAHDHAHLIETVAPERVAHELWGMLSAVHPDGVHRALAFLRDAGLLTRIIPEFRASIGFDQQNPHHHLTLDEHVFQAIRYAVLRNANPTARLALLLHDIAKPATQSFGTDGVAHYYQHEVEGAHAARTILERLRFSNDVLHAVVRIVRQHMRPPRQASTRSLRRWVNDLGPDWIAALECREADLHAHVLPEGFDPRAWADHVRERCQAFSADIASFDERALAVSGADLMREFGVPAGPELGRLKKLAARAVVDGELENQKEIILEWLNKRTR
jgi:tRNA nucleotidyltransferase (CCA-adding enzyme)